MINFATGQPAGSLELVVRAEPQVVMALPIVDSACLTRASLSCSEVVFWFRQEQSTVGISQQCADSSRKLDSRTR